MRKNKGGHTKLWMGLGIGAAALAVLGVVVAAGRRPAAPPSPLLPSPVPGPSPLAPLASPLPAEAAAYLPPGAAAMINQVAATYQWPPDLQPTPGYETDTLHQVWLAAYKGQDLPPMPQGWQGGTDRWNGQVAIEQKVAATAKAHAGSSSRV